MASAGGIEAQFHDGHAGAATKRRNAWVLTILCSAQLVLTIDISIVNVANPTIERVLHFNSGNLQWTVTAYALTYGGFLLLGGRMADLFGRRRLFIIGVASFAITSMCAGSSRNTIELIASRAGQGMCAALISPTLLSLLAAQFPEGRPRQRAYGMWATASSLGAAVGLVAGGVITSALGWRWIFFINGPMAVLAIVGAWVVLPRVEEHARTRRRLDVPGAVLVTAGFALVIYGLGEAQSTSWSSRPTILAFCCAPILLLSFFLVERRTAEPLFPMALLRRRVAVGNALVVLQYSLSTGGVFLVPLYMQQVWGFSAGRSGFATLPFPIGFAIGACTGVRLVERFGARRVIMVGLSLTALGTLWLARVPLTGNFFSDFLPPMIIRAIGQGSAVVPIVLTATSGVRRQDQGIAAGLYNMSQQLGGALGLAVLATVAAAASTSVGGGIAGEAHGIRIAFLVSVGIAIFGVTLAFFAMERHRTKRGEVDDEDDPTEPAAVSSPLARRI